MYWFTLRQLYCPLNHTVKPDPPYSIIISVKTKTIKPAEWPKFIPWLILVVVLLIGTGLFTYSRLAVDTDPLPTNLRAKLPFSPFVIPTDTKNYTTSNYQLLKPENNVQELEYQIHVPNGATVWLSEYTQPPQFTEINGYKDQFLTNVAQQYETVQTSNGTIYLGHLPRQNNKQIGIMLERGLIVFMNPSKELSQSQWHSLGERLTIQKLSD